MHYKFDFSLPENTTIYVSITPYNLLGLAENCSEFSFTTKKEGVEPEAEPECLEQIPNVFTPTGDGLNDFFDPVSSLEACDQIIDKAELYILNRWGEVIFSANPYLPWDGSNGIGYSVSKVPQGQYFYQLVYETAGIERTATGSILLLTEGKD
jgi:gliding motility-associated-like protein